MNNSSKTNWSPWPIAITGFFALAIAGAVAFVLFCNMHPEELVSSDYYEREVRYQGQMEKMARAHELPNRLSLAHDVEKQELSVGLPAEAFDDTTTGQISLYRPSASRFDRTIALDSAKGATQVVETRHLPPGLWRVRVSWNYQGQEYWAEDKVILEQAASAGTQASASVPGSTGATLH
jgi:hypothetical protein